VAIWGAVLVAGLVPAWPDAKTSDAAIMTVLSAVKSADFVFLQRTTGLTKGNLSSHLTKLEDAGLVRIEKRFVRKKPNTNVELTAEGKKRVANHWVQLDRLKSLSETPPEG
jgi:DNA-binding MarR family transcriptional regulator